MSNTTNARRTISYASIFSIINKLFGFSLVYFGHDKSTLTTKTVEAEESCLRKMKAYFQIQIFTLKWNTWKLWNPKIQIWIDLRNSEIWSGQIQDYLNQHPRLQVQVHDHHYSPIMTQFITSQRFRAGRLVFSPKSTKPWKKLIKTVGTLPKFWVRYKK